MMHFFRFWIYPAFPIYTPIGRKSVQNFPQQFGLIDVLCGLYFPFRDEYDISITYPSTANSLDGYKPDAIVKYRHKLDGREYDFILEFKRTRTPKAIFEEKIRLNEKITNFKFAVLLHFKEFEKAVWVMPGGRRVNIIT